MHNKFFSAYLSIHYNWVYSTIINVVLINLLSHYCPQLLNHPFIIQFFLIIIIPNDIQVTTCNVASIAVNKFVVDADTYNFQELYDVTKVLVTNLDKIVDVNHYPFEEVGGVVWCGVVWCGVVWCGVVWCGVV